MLFILTFYLKTICGVILFLIKKTYYFIENAEKLTTSEYNILEYYINGYEIADIPDLACISMNTVRKHNRSIYEKLNVKSNDELKLYTDLLKRCGRITELERETDEPV